MKQISITKTTWIDLVFENRNKAYGAYALRKNSDKTLFTSFLFASFIFLAFIISFKLISSSNINRTQTSSEYFLEPVNPDLFIQKEVEIPVVVNDIKAPASVKDQIKFTQPTVVSSNTVIDDIATISDFDDKIIGNTTIDGNPEGTIIVDSNVGTDVSGTSTNVNTDDVFHYVENAAVPFGGLSSFYKSFISKFRSPDISSDVTKLRVVLSFVVEKNGSLSDIKVISDPGYGAAKEAIRVLKSMPNWTPAIQNGTKVRSQFTLPITINVQ